jgi:UDP-glucose 4-epimerase
MTVFGDGEQTRAFSHVDDVAPHIARSVQIPEAYQQVINIGADTPHTVNHLAGVVARAMGVTPDVRHLEARNEVTHAFSDHTKARVLFGDAGPISLEEGVRRMAAWARSVGARRGQEFGEIEVARKLPASWTR